jgi:putative membrane protein
MESITMILIGLIAAEHLYFLWMEMFAWETAGKKAFGEMLPDELFKPTKGLAANQGLYNGFLAGGLLWTFFISDPIWKENISLFFLGCVIIAGIYGGITASRKILLIQALPASIALLFVLLR